jgi:hypothetical protein
MAARMPGNFLSPLAKATTSEVSRDGSGALETRSLVRPSIRRPWLSKAQPTTSPTAPAFWRALSSFSVMKPSR